MFANVLSGAAIGINACPVSVEVDIARGLPQILIVGLPDASINESRERVRAAIKSSGFELPLGRIVVNMAPADLRKEGSHFDLPIAIGILMSSGQLVSKGKFWLLGELSLNGLLKPASGVLPIVAAAREWGIKSIIVPKANSHEAALIKDINVYSAANLKEAVEILSEEEKRSQYLVPPQEFNCNNSFEFNGQDIKYVKGQYQAKRALEISAAGGHNLLFVGEPGGGKSMLAQCLPSILPPLTNEMSLEVTKIYSVAGLLKDESKSVILGRPFRSPHHSISGAGLIGGGSNPKPGEVSLAHHGVLFLDELAEFDKRTLDNLRQPIESGEVVISRARLSVKYPSKFLLIAACNPYTGLKQSGAKKKLIISAPLWDRFGLVVWVPPLKPDELIDFNPDIQESSASVRERVLISWTRQSERFKHRIGSDVVNNSSMKPQDIKEFCVFTEPAKKLLREATVSLSLTGRTYDHVLRVSKTIADLVDADEIEEEHVAEAIQYRISQESIIN
ncbi:MAG: YifB family Mg chelatase-like AAA ATPase [Candidatus Caenarcaniphilales bacterium]|nr:YifB family Mg chelatase-like AAA ATPase [Candidatus Caenarcaniphilales bacterium]